MVESMAYGLATRSIGDAVRSSRVDGTAYRGRFMDAQCLPVGAALAATKESIRRIQATRAPDRAEREDLILSCYMSDDFRGAVQAFVEKRKYTWTGR